MSDIRSTGITEGHVEMLLATDPEIETADLWVRFGVHCEVESKRPLAEAQLTALQLVQAAIASEIRALTALAGRNT